MSVPKISQQVKLISNYWYSLVLS